MRLALTRPLIWMDTETTGTSPDIDRIVQIGVEKESPDGTLTQWETLVNPGGPIPPEATEIHGITDEMVGAAPTFKYLANKLFERFEGADVGGYNVRFDVRMFDAEFRRVGLLSPFKDSFIVDSNKIFHMRFRRRLEDAVREYLGEAAAAEFKTKAHSAWWDAHWSRRVFEAQLERHEDLPRTAEDIDQHLFWTPRDGAVDGEGKFIWRFGEACFNFGKFPGLSLRKCDRGYLEWMLKQSFNDDVKEIVRNALQNRYPIKPKVTE